MENSSLNDDNNSSSSDSVSEDSVSHSNTNVMAYNNVLNTNFPQPETNLDTVNQGRILFNRRRRRLNNIMTFFSRDELQALNARNSLSDRGLSRMSRRRFRHIGDEIDSNLDEDNKDQMVDEDYVDFREYPLNLDWKDVENESSIAYDVLTTYGQVGLSLYTSLKNYISMESVTINSFFIKIIDKYASILAKETLLKEEVFNALPRLSRIRELLYKKLIKKEDVIPIKIILDIFELYYKKFDYPMHQNYLKEFIPTAFLFYSALNRNDFKLICDSYHLEMKTIKMFDVVLFSRKQQYLTHYKKLKADLVNFKSGLKKSQFII